mgnify:CR=1 FL=1
MSTQFEVYERKSGALQWVATLFARGSEAALYDWNEMYGHVVIIPSGVTQSRHVVLEVTMEL